MTTFSGGKQGGAADLPDGALQFDSRQQHGEGDVVLVQHASSYPVKRHLEPNAGSTANPEALLLSPPPHTRAHARTHPGTAGHAPYLEEVLGDDGEALRVVGDALQVRVLVQDVVVDVQEELQGVLVQEVYLEVAKAAVSACAGRAGAPGWARPRSPASGTPW